jgi:hypothetical protein
MAKNDPSPAAAPPAMERTDLLIAFLAFGAAVCTLAAWLWSAAMDQQQP